MTLHNENRELQIKLTELQIRHQHLASFFTVIISIGASITVSFFTAYLSIGMMLRDLSWIISAFIGFFSLGLITFLVAVLYIRERNKLKQQIENLKKQYVW